METEIHGKKEGDVKELDSIRIARPAMQARNGKKEVLFFCRIYPFNK